MSRQSDYIAAVLADAPAAYYVLDEASDNPQDSSGNGNHTTTTRDGTSPTVTYAIGGPSGLGATRAMDSHNRCFIVPSPVLTVVDNWTLECWVGNASTNGSALPPCAFISVGRNTAAGSSAGTGNGYGIGVDNSAHIGVDFNNGGGSPGSGSDPSEGLLTVWGANCLRGNTSLGGSGANTKWSHILVIRRAGNLEYWVDTQSESPAFGASFAPGTPTTETRIFKGNTTFNLDQYMCHAAFYSTALSSARINAHYNIFAAAIQADYPFNSLLSAGGGTEYPSSGRIELL